MSGPTLFFGRLSPREVVDALGNDLVARGALHPQRLDDARALVDGGRVPATALLDLRLVLGNDHQRQTQRVADHIRAQGYLVLDRDPTPAERLANPLIAKVLIKSGYNAQRTPLDLPIARRVVVAVQQTMPKPVVLMPSLGGTLPLYLFEKILKTNALLTVPVANYDSNQHGENENIRIQNLWDGIESIGSIMMMGGK